MDDRPAATLYCCPNEARAIDRATHLARLASFYPACGTCAHREDRARLTSIQRGQWSQLQARHHTAPAFDGEGLVGVAQNFDAHVVRRFAAALAELSLRDSGVGARPSILVGSLGHWTTADFVAAACESIALAGCQAVDAGAVTSASLVAAMEQQSAEAALVIGNSRGQSHAVSLKAWGRGGRPWSSPGRLDPLRVAYEAGVSRPRRSGGIIRRIDSATAYREPLRSLFHGLRPLRLVLDSACAPLWAHWTSLAAQSACQAIRPAESFAPVASAIKPTARTSRVPLIADTIVAHDAHFGIWVDGDGESFRLVDERGCVVENERVTLALVSYVRRQQQDAVVLLEPDASPMLRQRLARDAQLASSAVTREAMHEAIEAASAALAVGPSGRVWFGPRPATADALLALCMVLSMLSADDRPLSAVLDAACAAG